MWSKLWALLRRKRLLKPGAALLLALIVAGYAYFSLQAVPGHFQYLCPAPAQISTDDGLVTNAGLRTLRETLKTVESQLTGSCEHTTMYAVAAGATVSVAEKDETGTALARMEALEDGAFALRPVELCTGRLIYPDEFLMGDHVAILDEQLAVALFKYAEPIDRRIAVGSQEYRIVGIARDQKRVGDEQEYTLYLPLRAIEKDDLPLDAVCVEAAPVEGAGGWSAFTAALKDFGGSGDAWSLTKERMNAALPLRMLGCAAGVLLVLFGLRYLNGCARSFYQTYKQRLLTQYAARMLPWTLGRGALLALGYAACALLFAQVFVVIVAPVYTFPEWVPAVLVEPTEISKTFWNVRQSMAKLTELRSPELLRVRFFRDLMGWACGASALFGGLCVGRATRRDKPKEKLPEPPTEPEA